MQRVDVRVLTSRVLLLLLKFFSELACFGFNSKCMNMNTTSGTLIASSGSVE